MPDPIDPTHGLLLAAFEARENGDTAKLATLGQIAENPALAEEIVREAEALAIMHPDNPVNKEAPATARETFLA